MRSPSAPTPVLVAVAVALSGALLLFDPLTPAFAVPKAVLLILLAALALPWLRVPALPVLAAVPLLLLAVGMAPDPAAAIWGQPPRAEGVLFFAAILVLGALARPLGDAEAIRLERLMQAAGALVALGVLAGVFGLPLPGRSGGFSEGHGATLGNPNTAGAVLAALLVHAAARGGAWRFLMPLHAAALFGTGSQAAWLAMLVGLAWLLPTGRLRRAALALLAAGAVLLFAALNLRSEPMPSAALRVELWGSALRALAPVPREDDAWGPVRALIGYGPEQQAEILERHRRPEQNRWEAGGHERVADRAHSLPLDLWLSFGLAGLAALFWMGRRIRSATEAASAAAALTLIAAGLPGFFGPAEWMLLAYWLARCGPSSEVRGTPPATGLGAGGAWLVALLLAALVWRGMPTEMDRRERQRLEAEYRRLVADPSPLAPRRLLAAQACARADRRTGDGEAALLCAQLALAADEAARARSAAIRASRLRPARPRAWLLRLLADPDRPGAALHGLIRTLPDADVDAATRAAFLRAIRTAALAHSALATHPDLPAVQGLLAGTPPE